MKCYFVYSIPYISGSSIISRIFNPLHRILLNKTFLKYFIAKRIYNREDFKKWPKRSPYENTKNIYLSLKEKWDTRLFHLEEDIHLQFRPEDIFIGHPFFPIKNNEWGITENAIVGEKRPRVKALITPLHCDYSTSTQHINKAFLDHVEMLSKHCDVLFTFMGEYWWDKWKESIYSDMQKKMIRMDMAIDIKYFPKIKKEFNKPGQRKFLYIGKNDPTKGITFLSDVAKSYQKGAFGWIGGGSEIDGITRIDGYRDLTPEFMEKIALEYDFFISPSVADANPTTILEAMAWGFPVLATKQSGYYESKAITNIFLNDVEKTQAVLDKFQNMDESELKERTDFGRTIVEEKYNWSCVTETIVNEVERLYFKESPQV
jgi:glycosyltransferase involved in cell wall biosynthesis